ncbi:MAG TPA: membrane protein insertion efficiency factor YidD [bacterium]|nr:membrane protein insertion efficiency factor YidD [bacterium]
MIREGWKPLQVLLAGIIRLYQILFSPLFPPCCRFYPSCSEYARLAVQNCGPVRGSWLALLRVLRCHPFHPGGVDFPPRGIQKCHEV